jgi:glycerol dehydrogenase-like iron-containing ADH family enzyme
VLASSTGEDNVLQLMHARVVSAPLVVAELCGRRWPALVLLRLLALPRSLADLGLGGATLEELQQVCAFACREGSDLHHLPFPVGPADLLGALVTTTAERQPA